MSPSGDARFITIGVTRVLKRQEYNVPVEGGQRHFSSSVGAATGARLRKTRPIVEFRTWNKLGQRATAGRPK